MTDTTETERGRRRHDRPRPPATAPRRSPSAGPGARRARQAVRLGRGGRRRVARDPARHARVVPRPVGLREDDAAADARRARAPDGGVDRPRRRRRHPPAGARAGHRHGVPVAGPVPPPRRPPQHRLPAAHQGHRPADDRVAGGRAAGARPPRRPGRGARSASCRAASASGWRSPGPSPASRRCSCSTSRCRPSTPTCARRCRSSCGCCSSAWASPRSWSRTTSARP